MFWLIFIRCCYTDHVICPCGGLHPLEDCFIYDEGDFRDGQPELFEESVLVHGDCEMTDVPAVRNWPIPLTWSNGEFVIKADGNEDCGFCP